MPYTLTQIRVLRAPVERVYRAFLDPAALAKWNAPDGFTCIVHELEAKPGGRFRISFVNFSSGEKHSFGGEYRELIPNERIVATDRFEDAGLPGENQLQDDEVVAFSWIVYRSREHRDEVNRKVMEDPRMQPPASGEWPFDARRLIFGGFVPFIGL